MSEPTRPSATDSPRGALFTPQAIIGVCIVLFGLLLTAENLGLLGVGHVLAYWPIVLIAIGIAMYRRAPDASGRTSAVFVAGAGVLLTSAQAIGWALSARLIWPFALIALGTVIVVRATNGGRVAETIGREQRISCFSVWSGVKRRVNSMLFQYADLTAVMGGIEIDLRQASTANDAVIDVLVVMGGLVIQVPPDWTVLNETVSIFAGVEDRTVGQAGAAHRVVLRGLILMGGIEVKT